MKHLVRSLFLTGILFLTPFAILAEDTGVTCPTTTVLYGDQCFTRAQLCTMFLGPRAWFKGGRCGCVPGYLINEDKTACLRDHGPTEKHPETTIDLRRDILKELDQRSLHPASSKAPEPKDLKTQMEIYGNTRKNYVSPERESYRVKRLESSKTATSYRLNDEYVQVLRVIDGESMEVRLLDHSRTIVRLLGIDAPSTARAGAALECFGNEAAQYLKRLLMRKGVTLHKDTSIEDKEDEDTLRSIDRGKTDVGMLLLWQGFVRIDRSQPFERQEDYEQLEDEARRFKKGLWGACERQGG